jgi:hypothetical protein
MLQQKKLILTLAADTLQLLSHCSRLHQRCCRPALLQAWHSTVLGSCGCSLPWQWCCCCCCCPVQLPQQAPHLKLLPLLICFVLCVHLS